MFRIPTRIRYALRALIRLSTHDTEKGPLALHQIAAEEGISVKYLENIFTQLRRAGIVRSIRGAEGGYLLAAPANSISILKIIEAVEGPAVTVDCVQHPDRCPQKNRCSAAALWDDLNALLKEFFSQRTLASIAVSEEGALGAGAEVGAPAKVGADTGRGNFKMKLSDNMPQSNTRNNKNRK
jgi:Rrf2 family protein